MNYPWYEVVSNSKVILQGDFVPECPIVVPPQTIKSDTEPEVSIQLIDSVVLSQSCDLENGNIEIVLVAPHYTLKTFLELLPEKEFSTTKAKHKVIDNLRKGHLPGYHILNKYENYLQDYQVVDFRNVYGINLITLKDLCVNLNRVRLLPPYREHLSQAFARYFMRVGLPQDLKIEGY